MTPDLAAAFKLSQNNGALIADVEPDSPAGRAGLQRGDIITHLNGQTIDDAAIVSQVTQRFDALRAESLPRGASRDMVRKVAEE